MPEEREFFEANLPREIKGAQYRVVGSPEEADLVVSVALTAHENPGNAALCTVGLIAAPNNSLLLELFWNYVDAREMRSWGVGSILAPEGPAAPGPRHTSLLPEGAAKGKE